MLEWRRGVEWGWEPSVARCLVLLSWLRWATQPEVSHHQTGQARTGPAGRALHWTGKLSVWRHPGTQHYQLRTQSIQQYSSQLCTLGDGHRWHWPGDLKTVPPPHPPLSPLLCLITCLISPDSNTTTRWDTNRSCKENTGTLPVPTNTGRDLLSHAGRIVISRPFVSLLPCPSYQPHWLTG